MHLENRPAITLRPKPSGCVFNCPHKNMVNVDRMFNLSRPKSSRLRTKCKLFILFTDPDYGSGITDPGLRIRITNLYHGSRLRKKDPDYGIRIRIILVIIGLRWTKVYQIFTPTIFHETIEPMARHLGFWSRCTLDEV